MGEVTKEAGLKGTAPKGGRECARVTSMQKSGYEMLYLPVHIQPKTWTLPETLSMHMFVQGSADVCIAALLELWAFGNVPCP